MKKVYEIIIWALFILIFCHYLYKESYRDIIIKFENQLWITTRQTAVFKTIMKMISIRTETQMIVKVLLIIKVTKRAKKKQEKMQILTNNKTKMKKCRNRARIHKTITKSFKKTKCQLNQTLSESPHRSWLNFKRQK